jgi:two-component system response regulator HupR/HoxA
MLVDDEPANLRTLLRLFRDEYQVFAVGSGDQALNLLGQHDVAVMISDQRMPNMTGIQLMTKAVELRPQMVKILLTGYTDVEALIESINSGLVYRYVTKPWNNDDLKLTVKRAMDHYETIKANHLIAMENGRLRSRLISLSEMALEAINDCNVAGCRSGNGILVPTSQSMLA